ncbi:hypothetical protein GCM10027217_04880 [Pseudomaricurvus hydrocarbonicus]
MGQQVVSRLRSTGSLKTEVNRQPQDWGQQAVASGPGNPKSRLWLSAGVYRAPVIEAMCLATGVFASASARKPMSFKLVNRAAVV